MHQLSLLNPLPSTFNMANDGTNMVRANGFTYVPILRLNIQIPEAVLKIPAQTSLMALQIWWLGTLDLASASGRQQKPDPGIESLVIVC